MPELDVKIDGLEATAYTIPTDSPESDGTKQWDSTTWVVVHAHAGGEVGLGYTYGPSSAAHLIASMLADSARGESALAPQRVNRKLRAALRDAGQAGLGALALSAVDIALHDLRARLLGLPLTVALGAVRDCVPIYGSGGFTTYDGARVAEQLGGWASAGIPRVKMKVGRHPEQDAERLAAAREAIGPDVELMVDANGAFSPDAALAWAAEHEQYGIAYFEEPVSSDDLPGLRHLRARLSSEIAVAAGEYSWSPFDTRRLLESEAVDIVQADVTRCGGISALLQIDALCLAGLRPFSAHCAPALTAHVGCAMASLIHSEYFHDHVRIEGMLLSGVAPVRDGALWPDRAVTGHGLSLRADEARRYQVWP
jgi:L-alanine-DL-glutamate epimerase-like enolase superfamily enzyme